MQLHTFVPNVLWTVASPLRTYGLEIGTRMSICRLSSGDLWIHSPIRPDVDLCAQIDALGPVRYIIAPVRHHHFFIQEFLAAYPQALLFGSPDLPDKRPDLDFAGILGDMPDPRWQADFDQVRIRGNLFHDEVVFWHRPSQTLIVADLCMSVHPEQPLLTRLVSEIAGIYQQPGPTLDVKLGYWNRAAAQASLQKVLEWDFDRMILSHGHLVEHDAKNTFWQAYRFIL